MIEVLSGSISAAIELRQKPKVHSTLSADYKGDFPRKPCRSRQVLYLCRSSPHINCYIRLQIIMCVTAASFGYLRVRPAILLVGDIIS